MPPADGLRTAEEIRAELHTRIVLVALEDLGSDDEPDHVVLGIGDSATNVALDGTLDEVRWLIAEAGAQLARLRNPHERPSHSGPWRDSHEHYRRIVTAAAIRPSTDLTAGGHVVLSWLARGDDTICAGVVDLINACEPRPISRLARMDGTGTRAGRSPAVRFVGRRNRYR